MNANSFALRVLTAALALGCLLGLSHLACILSFHVPFDPNEGWNAYFTQAALATGSPYPPAGGTMINNYPPLSFYVVGALARLVGDAIVAGRIIALIALFALALGIEAAARQMGCNRIEAAFAALFFTAGLMLTTDYAGMDDPQMLGHAIAAGGLVLGLREPRTPRAMVGAALLFTFAFFVKHNLVVLPAALALWFTLLDRRLAFTFVASGMVFALIGLGLFKDYFGFSLFSRLSSARLYDASNIWAGAKIWLAWSAIPLAGAAALYVRAKHDRHAVFCAIYATMGTLAGLYFLGGDGVDFNALFDADIALALGAGVAMNRLQFDPRQWFAAALYAIPLALCLWTLDAKWWRSDFWLHPMMEERASAAAEIALLRDAKGPVICEMLSLCYWAQKPATFDVFNMGEAYRTGARSDAELARAIAAKRYDIVQLEELSPFPLTPGIERALVTNYRIARRDDDRVFFVPNRGR
jgi:hypothetical protein